jgi:acetyl esterase/lipase
MRMSRVPLVGTVILALLLGLGGGALAQSSDEEVGLRGPVVFGEDPEWQRLWVRTLEPRDAPRPAVVWFHGGGLIYGHPLHGEAAAEFLADLGFVTFLAGYRLFDPATGENPWPAQLDDAQRAVRWVRAHADEYNVDPERVCADGYSSGGHLVGLLGTLDTRDDSDPDLAGFSSRPDCAFMGAGDGDLTVPYPEEYYQGHLLADIKAGLLGGTLDEVPGAWEAASPAHNVDADTPPFLVIHGTDDETMPVEMSRNFVEAMREAGREVEYLELPGGHVEILSHPEFLPAVARYYVDRMNPAE